MNCRLLSKGNAETVLTKLATTYEFLPALWLGGSLFVEAMMYFYSIRLGPILMNIGQDQSLHSATFALYHYRAFTDQLLFMIGISLLIYFVQRMSKRMVRLWPALLAVFVACNGLALLYSELFWSFAIVEMPKRYVDFPQFAESLQLMVRIGFCTIAASLVALAACLFVPTLNTRVMQ